jgi:type II secretory pathway pseudopilin PulG
MKFPPTDFRRPVAAFTMVEIAICLAIIGIALVGIIGVLPYGMNTQRDTREETLINQDVTELLPMITQGMRGVDDLTNYVYAITNYWTLYNSKGEALGAAKPMGYTFNSTGGALPPYPSQLYSNLKLTNGANIIGLLSTPEYVGNIGNYPAVPEVINGNGNGYEVYSNHIVAYVHSLSGLASEKPPQDNTLMVNGAFSYRMLVVNAPVALSTNDFDAPYNQQIWQNQRELRLTFLSPEQPNGTVGNNRLTFRTTIAGQLLPSYVNNFNNDYLYFYQPQSFNVNTND